LTKLFFNAAYEIEFSTYLQRKTLMCGDKIDKEQAGSAASAELFQHGFLCWHPVSLCSQA
jgi:hypothetical protein